MTQFSSVPQVLLGIKDRQEVMANLGIESFQTWNDPRTDNVQLEVRYEQGNKKKFELSPEFIEDYGIEDVLVLLHP